jgi:hypothetical protein
MHTSTAPINFNKMFIAAGGALREALAEHRVLTCTWRHLIFVIANTDDRDAALATADAHTVEQKGTRPVYTILISDEHLAALKAIGKMVLNMTVLDAQNNHAPADTAIKVNNVRMVNISTEHGPFFSTLATSRDLRAGDVYAGGNYDVDGDGNEGGRILYRALADYNPETGRVEHHIVTRHWNTASAADKANLTGALTGGPDNLVHRIVGNHERVIARLNLDDVLPVID